MQVICDNCDEIYFNCIFNPDATVEHPSENKKSNYLSKKLYLIYIGGVNEGVSHSL